MPAEVVQTNAAATASNANNIAGAAATSTSTSNAPAAQSISTATDLRDGAAKSRAASSLTDKIEKSAPANATPNTYSQQETETWNRVKAAAQKTAQQNLEKIQSDPNTPANVKEQVESNYKLRASIADEGLPYEKFLEGETNAALKKSILSSLMDNGAKEGKDPFAKAQTLASAPKYFDKDTQRLLGMDANKIWEIGLQDREALGAALNYNNRVKQGVPIIENLITLQNERKSGVEPPALGTIGRKAGDYINLYDRVLLAKHLQSSIENGKIEISQGTIVGVPRSFASDKNAYLAAERSLRNLGATATQIESLTAGKESFVDKTAALEAAELTLIKKKFNVK